MFGQHPLDFHVPPPPTVDTLPAYASTRELLDIAHQRQTSQYNQHHRPLQFEPGDLVWITTLSGIVIGK